MIRHTSAAISLLVPWLSASCLEPPATHCRTSDGCAAPRTCVLGRCEIADTGENRRADGGPAAPDVDEAACPEPDIGGETDLAINEILVDVPPGPRGDTNRDGRRDATGDEFVEIVNAANRPVDLGPLEVTVDSDPVHDFEPTCLDPRRGIVLFGGSTGALEGPRVRSASALGLSNGGGRLSVVDRRGRTAAAITWSDPPEASLTLSPQIDGDEHHPHTAVESGRAFSPGRCASGRPLVSGCPRPIEGERTPPDAGDAGE